MRQEPSAPTHPDTAAGPDHGLSDADLRGELASDLPDRDAMSVVGIGGLEVGLPLPPQIDDALGVGLGELNAGLTELPDGALATDPTTSLLDADIGAGVVSGPTSGAAAAEASEVSV